MKFATKSELIYNILKSQIVNGVLTQGKAINISELAKKNEMSTIPVRESLKRLEAEGFVKIIPYKGAIVTSYDEEKIIEVMLIRGVLEGFIAKTVLGNITEYQIKELKMRNPAHPTKRTKLVAEKSQLGYMFKVGIILRDEYEYKKELIEEQLLEI